MCETSRRIPKRQGNIPFLSPPLSFLELEVLTGALAVPDTCEEGYSPLGVMGAWSPDDGGTGYQHRTLRGGGVGGLNYLVCAIVTFFFITDG